MNDGRRIVTQFGFERLLPSLQEIVLAIPSIIDRQTSVAALLHALSQHQWDPTPQAIVKLKFGRQMPVGRIGDKVLFQQIAQPARKRKVRLKSLRRRLDLTTSIHGLRPCTKNRFVDTPQIPLLVRPRQDLFDSLAAYGAHLSAAVGSVHQFFNPAGEVEFIVDICI